MALAIFGLHFEAILTGADDGLAIASAKVRREGERFWAEVVLENRSRKRIRIWSPTNVEGMQCLSFEFRGASGEVTEFRPPIPPRAGGVATSILLEPGVRTKLGDVDLAEALRSGAVSAGEFRVVARYRNDLAERPPVRGVWVGRISAKPFQVRLVK